MNGWHDMTLNYLYTVGRQKIIVNATEEDSGQVGSVAITDQEEEIRVYEDAMDDDGSDAEDMTTMHVEREEDGGGDEDKEYECDDLMDEEDGLLNDDSVLRAEDMSSHNDTVSSDVLQPTSSAVVHASTTSSSSRASNSRPSPSHSKPHPQTQMMKSKRPIRTLGLQLEYEEVSAAKVGGSFSVGCLPKHLAQPKGNALFPGKYVGDAYVSTVGYSIICSQDDDHLWCYQCSTLYFNEY